MEISVINIFWIAGMIAFLIWGTEEWWGSNPLVSYLFGWFK